MLEFLKIQYNLGKVTAEQLHSLIGRSFAGKVFNEEDYVQIIGGDGDDD